MLGRDGLVLSWMQKPPSAPHAHGQELDGRSSKVISDKPGIFFCGHSVCVIQLLSRRWRCLGQIEHRQDTRTEKYRDCQTCGNGEKNWTPKSVSLWHILDCSNNLPGMEPPRANSQHQLGLAHHLGHPVCHKSRAQPGHYCLEWSYVYGYTIDECLSLLACSFLPLPTYLQLFGTLAALSARDRPHHHHSRALGQWLQHFEVVVVDRALVAPLHRPLGSINIPPDGG